MQFFSQGCSVLNFSSQVITLTGKSVAKTGFRFLFFFNLDYVMFSIIITGKNPALLILWQRKCPYQITLPYQIILI
jgi:hypothetical protein